MTLFKYKDRSDGTFTVYPLIVSEDDTGRRTTRQGTPLTVVGRLYSMTSEERLALGNSGIKDTDVVKKFRCPKFPCDRNCKVKSPDGSLWTVVGDPVRPTHARIKREDVVTLRKVSS